MTLDDVHPGDDQELARELLRLQKSAYRIEAALIEDDRIPPLWESEEDLRAAKLHWLVQRVDLALQGAVAWEQDAESITIDRLIVDPALHRCGTGSALVREVAQRAEEAGQAVRVTTGRDNRPARRLYESLRFVHQGDVEVLSGLWLAKYKLH